MARQRRQSGRTRPWARALIAGGVAFGVVFAGSVATAGVATAADASVVTVTAAQQDADHLDTAPLPDLAVTVSQTAALTAQAITVSWTGGKASTLPSSQNGGENYLQIMQCWGSVTEADGSVAPDRTTCQFGGFSTNSAGAGRDQFVEDAARIASEDDAYSYVGSSFFDPSYTGIPFRSVSGVDVTAVVDGKRVAGVNLNTNEFFSAYTTNEVPWAGSDAVGAGSITFETQTTLASPGLGCGAVITAADGSQTPRGCWLVIVPRGEGTNTASPLFWEQWKHHLAVPLGFQAVGQKCAIGAEERQLAGTELVADAVSSWQPSLCGAAGGDAYTLLTTTDVDAAATANTTADAPLAFTSRPIQATAETPDNLVYAPVALTGVAVTFAIDRFPSSDASADAQERARQPFTQMNLTPRLLAKLLTSSYIDSLPADADAAHLAGNARNLLFDEEFLEINDAEWADQAIVNPAVADIMMPQGRSGYAQAIWSYILADEEARDFLAGVADPWGMTVNPYASTDAAINPTGTALELPRDDFPKVDPSEAYAGEARVLNSVTWRPYTNDLAAGAYYVLRGDGLTLGDWDPISIPAKWTRKSRNLVGERKVLALTDTSGAARYQTVTAALRNPAGKFVVPSTDALSAAAAAMRASATQPQTLEFDPASAAAREAPSAYPLALPVYAATNVSRNSAGARKAYAAFISYAATAGQTPGVEAGQLPDGYAPLPQGWRDQALAVAALVAAGAPSTAPPTSHAPPATVQSPRAAAAVAAAAPVASAPAPVAAGVAAGALSAGSTPDDPQVGALTSALPLSALAGALAAGAVPFVGRLRRRP